MPSRAPEKPGDAQLIQIVLPLPPSINRLWRTSKNGGMYRSGKYAEWRTAAIWQASVQVKSKAIAGKYKATFQFVRPDKRRRDLDNLLKAAMDVIVSAKIVEDDHLCEWLEARWVKEGPQCLIVLEPIGEDTA